MESQMILASSTVLIILTSILLINRIVDWQHGKTAEQVRCQRPKKLHHRLPLGLDLIYELFRADRRKCLPEYLRERFARAGTPTYSYIFLNRSAIFTCDPRNLQAILSTQFQDFSLGPTRRANFSPFLGHGIFTEDGEDWESSRAMLRPHFTRSQISDLRSEEAHVQKLINVLPVDKSGWTAQVDLQTLFFRLTLDSATEFLFGRSICSQDASRSEGVITEEVRFGKAFDTCSRWLANRARMNEAYWVLDGSTFRSNCEDTHNYVDKLVDDAMRERAEKTDGSFKNTVLDSLLEQTSDRTKIRSELISLLLAGRDTTAGLLGWLFHVLIRHQEIYAKLRGIIVDEFGSYNQPKDISLAKIRECQYLQHCINETLRLYPPVPANTRQALRDTTIPRGGGPDGLGKVFVRKGQQVNYTVYALHRREDLWSDANTFQPERWINKKFGWDYLPFNGGPRVCLGQQLALTQVSYVTIRLLQRFDRMKNSGVELVEKHNLSLTSSPYLGVNAILHGAM